MTAVDWTRLSPRRLLLALVPALLLLALMAPGPPVRRAAGDGCTAEVNATQDPTVANFNVTCPDGRAPS